MFPEKGEDIYLVHSLAPFQNIPFKDRYIHDCIQGIEPCQILQEIVS